jgi:hypothetical protein
VSTDTLLETGTLGVEEGLLDTAEFPGRLEEGVAFFKTFSRL